jgi:hypothetical protein
MLYMKPTSGLAPYSGRRTLLEDIEIAARGSSLGTTLGVFDRGASTLSHPDVVTNAAIFQSLSYHIEDVLVN